MEMAADAAGFNCGFRRNGHNRRPNDRSRPRFGIERLMARIVFVQKIAEEWLGPMYLSAMLKKHGHETNAVVAVLEKDPVERVVALQPDIVAFSCLTKDYHWALRVAARIRDRCDALRVFGGTHVMLNAETVIAQPEVDALCVGEGEHAIAELADAVAAGTDYSSIPNLWVKRNGDIVRNGMRNLVEDLDTLPFPDRKLYAAYPYFAKRAKRPIAMSRGCPYDCTYCHNSPKKALFHGKGKYVRWRSVDNVLAEIDDIERSGYVHVLHYIDDGFGMNRAYMKELLTRLLARERRHNMQANLRADMVTDELCVLLREYGPSRLRLRIAVESGNEEYRRVVLKKSLTNGKLLQAAETFHRHGVGFSTYNMLCLPGETYENGLETLRLNLQLRPSGTYCFVFQPYPGTALADYAVEKGYLTRADVERLGSSDDQAGYGSRSPLRQPEVGKLQNLQRMFQTVIRFPILAPIATRLARYRAASLLAKACYTLYFRIELLHRKLTHNY
jgi:anaerobic magnesium-protoporphyrin IX monomethyl ester cyclase